ncbi:MAG: hypothetical protein JWL86_2131 [Rhizobium sp.]|nr:hypothetical protein [Rhizobium sp.]
MKPFTKTLEATGHVADPVRVLIFLLSPAVKFLKDTTMAAGDFPKVARLAARAFSADGGASLPIQGSPRLLPKMRVS